MQSVVCCYQAGSLGVTAVTVSLRVSHWCVCVCAVSLNITIWDKNWVRHTTIFWLTNTYTRSALTHKHNSIFHVHLYTLSPDSSNANQTMFRLFAKEIKSRQRYDTNIFRVAHYLFMHTMGVGVWYGVGTWECPYFWHKETVWHIDVNNAVVAVQFERGRGGNVRYIVNQNIFDREYKNICHCKVKLVL